MSYDVGALLMHREGLTDERVPCPLFGTDIKLSRFAQETTIVVTIENKAKTKILP